MSATIKQQCPYCDYVLTYEVSSHGVAGNGEYTVKALTTPESTAHVWTHAPKEAE